MLMNMTFSITASEGGLVHGSGNKHFVGLIAEHRTLGKSKLWRKTGLSGFKTWLGHLTHYVLFGIFLQYPESRNFVICTELCSN